MATRRRLAMGIKWQSCRFLLLGALVAGCARSASLPEHNASFPHYATDIDSLPREAGRHGEMPQPGDLDDLIRIAIQSHPELRAARARVDAAYGRMVQAGLCPNPLFGPHFSQLGEGGGPLGEAGAQLTQVIVTANKLGIARAAASFGVEAADWQ